MSRRHARLIIIATLLSMPHFIAADSVPGESIPAESLPPLPMATSNNAVAVYADEDGMHLVSAMGLGAGKSRQDISDTAWRFSADDGKWVALEAVPKGQGRLAASAATVAGSVYLFGGYTVAEDGSEVSTPGVYRLEPHTREWAEFSHMPVPVDDAVAVPYQDRYIYLVSGWHDVGNVNLVQMLDTQTGAWQQASPWPGTPVFGQAGSLSGDAMLICDGVRVVYHADSASRQFVMSDECWLGKISADDPRRIHWQPIARHPGKPRYRMAAGSTDSDQAWFVGGSVNPYNYDGIGYNGKTSEPEPMPFSYDFSTDEWSCHPELIPATMDHRGLPWHDGWFYLAGGMLAGQQLSDKTLRFKPSPAVPCP